MLREGLLLLVVTAWACCGAPAEELVAAAKQQIGVTRYYDSGYRKLGYPGGDPPMDRGVCTDVLVRAYRLYGVDLQVLIHKDIVKNWNLYPNPWRAKGPDRNIDHRRVPNQACFFGRYGESLPITRDDALYLPGDIVTWTLPSGLPHIGIVSDVKGRSGAPMVIHNIGYGTKEDDILFLFKVVGHYRCPPTRLLERQSPSPDGVR